MRFCLHSGRTEVQILSDEQAGRSSLNNIIKAEINPHDKSGPTYCALRQLQDCYKVQFSCGQADYIKFMDDTFSQGGLNVRCDWNSITATLSLTVTGRTLKVLKDLFGSSSEIRVLLCEANAKFVDKRTWNLTSEPNVKDVVTRGMRISVFDDITGTCTDTNVEIPKPWKPYLTIPGIHNPNIYFYAKESLTAHCHLVNLCKKMLEEEIQADLTLITSDGAQVKCHKSFLAAQSPVFTAMFQSDCKESSTSKIEMPQIDEVVVKAFLAYLYYGDLTEAEGDSNIAFDLFEASHKYEVKTLEEHTKHMLLHKSNDWMDVGVAFRLFSIYGKMEGCEDLRTKAIHVMRVKYEELEESEDYNQLFATDPQGAKELCTAFVSQ